MGDPLPSEPPSQPSSGPLVCLRSKNERTVDKRNMGNLCLVLGAVLFCVLVFAGLVFSCFGNCSLVSEAHKERGNDSL